jgi:hypothetical protein
MPRSPSRHRDEWTAADEKEFRKLVKQNTPTRLLAMKLKRTESSVRNKARALRLSLRPTNQAPYG